MRIVAVNPFLCRRESFDCCSAEWLAYRSSKSVREKRVVLNKRRIVLGRFPLWACNFTKPEGEKAKEMRT